jgi:protein TonB
MGQGKLEMLGQTTRRDAATHEHDRSRLYFALVILLMALAVVVVKDREFWFGDADAAVADQASPEWNPNSVIQPTPTSAPAAQPTKHVVAAKNSIKPVVTAPAAVAIVRNVLPPLEVEVVAGDTRGTFHLGSNPVKIEMLPDSGAVSTSSERGPATVATERVQMPLNGTDENAPAKAKTIEASYPLLGRQMKVQGSVLLQALIGADGIIRELRVLGGPAILASAAREAARRWQFKPYLQNGKPVETQANIAVNFTIKVLNNGARDQMDSVVALSRGGE